VSEVKYVLVQMPRAENEYDFDNPASLTHGTMRMIAEADVVIAVDPHGIGTVIKARDHDPQIATVTTVDGMRR
jgi:hypothetical protein